MYVVFGLASNLFFFLVARKAKDMNTLCHELKKSSNPPLAL